MTTEHDIYGTVADITWITGENPATTSGTPVHWTPEEPDQPACDADVDAPEGTEMLGTLNPDRVTCPECRKAATCDTAADEEIRCRHAKCGRAIVRCETLPAHFGCSSARGWLHVGAGAHACEARSDGPYAEPEEESR
jgi:hypothetical protein